MTEKCPKCGKKSGINKALAELKKRGFEKFADEDPDTGDKVFICIWRDSKYPGKVLITGEDGISLPDDKNPVIVGNMQDFDMPGEWTPRRKYANLSKALEDLDAMAKRGSLYSEILNYPELTDY